MASFANKDHQHLHQRLFDHAFAMNNMAVVMVQRGQLGCASRTFKESSVLIRSILGLAAKEEESLPEIQALAHGKHQLASQRLAKASCLASFPDSVQTMDSTDLFALKQVASLHGRPPLVFIRDPAVYNEETAIKESGIVLYNYGVSCYLLALNSASPASCSSHDHCLCFDPRTACSYDFEQASEVAYKILSKAHAIFTQLFPRTKNHQDRLILRPEEESLEAHIFTMLAVSALVRVLHARKDVARAWEAEQSLRNLTNSLEYYITSGGAGALLEQSYVSEYHRASAA